ncbi:MAG: rRNA maturation RNAse YbeY [Vicingaceae bacterium]|nr:rRNA maturation RNAse YbeY [Vicingaceae bacterium]
MKENVIKLNQNIVNELFRIIIHGVLHLLGYKDKSPNDKKIMTDKEDFYLTLYSNK